MSSTDTSRPDYQCPAYLEMESRWALVEDIRAGTAEIRAKPETYLPKFEAETTKDWAARIAMSFVADHYATTVAEHVGLVLADPIKLGEDVPQQIRDLCEDIDGDGNHLDVFAQSALDAALHLGHCVLLTDYPVTDSIKSKADEKAALARPYVTLYRASDVLSPQAVTVGGALVLVRIMLRESGSEPDGEFGVKQCTRYREIRQEVFYDEVTGRARSLGAITWRAWRQADKPDVAGQVQFDEIGSGTIVGPPRIAARIIYGGEKLGLLHTKPHLYGLALSNLEETQVASDYAAVMHKCNVPTPVFIGRNVKAGDASTKTVQMGQGIDIPIGGDVKMLEPSGVALGATRQRLEDLRVQMRRQGATMDDATSTEKTATEAKLYAKQRNAKLARAARSLQDALEGVNADFAAFMGLPDGGSVAVAQDFAGGTGLDPDYLQVLVQAFVANGLPLPALLYALEKGRLPEDFQLDPETKRFIGDELARRKAEWEAEKAPTAVDATPIVEKKVA